MDAMIEKIRALLALAADEGATEAEATLAAERAQALMLKHGIELAQIAMSEAQARAIGADTAYVEIDTSDWAIALADGVATSVGGTVVMKPNRRGRRPDGSAGIIHGGITFICPGDTAESAAELFRWLHVRLTLLSTEAMRTREETWVHGRQWRRSWLTGAAIRIGDRLKERYTAAEQAAETGSALVLMRDAVAEKIEEMFPRRGTHRPRYAALHEGAFRTGESVADAMDLGGPKIDGLRGALPGN